MRSLLAALLLVFAACSTTDSQTPAPGPTAPAKDVATAKAWIAAGAHVIDVRTEEEFDAAHLDRATNLPIEELPARMAEVEKLVGGDKTARVVVYCASGNRAGKAKLQLDAAGYTQVVNGGGYDDLAP
ncbi:MAG: rhodanese-like domain-containing protein [Kofleriaceae bacterium]